MSNTYSNLPVSLVPLAVSETAAQLAQKRIEELEIVLSQTAVAYHCNMKHKGEFEKCRLIVCRKARTIIAKGK